MYELEDFPPGSVVLTPSGRRAVIRKHLSGSSKHDHFSRLICQYEGSDSKDLVTLQPHLLRYVDATAERGQMCPANDGVFNTSS